MPLILLLLCGTPIPHPHPTPPACPPSSAPPEPCSPLPCTLLSCAFPACSPPSRTPHLAFPPPLAPPSCPCTVARQHHLGCIRQDVRGAPGTGGRCACVPAPHLVLPWSPKLPQASQRVACGGGCRGWPSREAGVGGSGTTVIAAGHVPGCSIREKRFLRLTVQTWRRFHKGSPWGDPHLAKAALAGDTPLPRHRCWLGSQAVLLASCRCGCCFSA